MAGRRPPIVWSPNAREDLSFIWLHYAKIAGTNTADKIIREIGAACSLLEQHPFGGRAREEIRSDLRSVVANPHVIFYRVRDDIAEIVRVLDGRQDLGEIFSNVHE
jgi:toxin ParE1/3/4